MLTESELNDLKEKVRYVAATQEGLIAVLKRAGILDAKALKLLHEEIATILERVDRDGWW